jgi:hypothetical protein
MIEIKRTHTLGIWALGLGYFLFYIPYSGLSKAVTLGLLTGRSPVSGFELLPSMAVATAVSMLLFITAMRWWKYVRPSQAGLHVRFPGLHLFISGVSFAVIIATTTLAYSFHGVSILLALILMRGGVLVISPIIDRVFHRHVRWFSWAGLVLSLMAIMLAFKDVREYQLAPAVLINLGAYLLAYALRLPCMTQLAKTGEKRIACGYFVCEQMVAMPVLVLLPAIFAMIGHGEVMLQLRYGFAHLFSADFALLGWAIGFCYTGLGIFCTFIYLDRRENTFCIPMYASSSMLSGIVASWALQAWLGAANPSSIQLGGAMLIMAALSVMSPLHHMPLYVQQLKDAVREKRLVLVDFRGGDPMREPTSRPARFITVNFHAVRQALHASRGIERR